jgi:hypothetical protein
MSLPGTKRPFGDVRAMVAIEAKADIGRTAAKGSPDPERSLAVS